MSVTTTQNPRFYSIARTLADYEPHYGNAESGEHDPSLNARPEPPSSSNSGREEDWETEYRRVPPYRPIDHELDFQSRNTTLNNIERFFLFNMFGGILIVSRLNRLWRATGGKLNTSYFRWKVGGEY